MKKNSIITEDWEHCFICGCSNNLQKHHVMFGTANRKQSEKYGLTIPLCMDCHLGHKGIHNNNQLDIYIKMYAQIKFEINYSHELWVKVFMKNYL